MNESNQVNCPICEKSFNILEIEAHVDKCLFLNSNSKAKEHKRKRNCSPPLLDLKKTLFSHGEPTPSSSRKQENPTLNKSLSNTSQSATDNFVTFTTPLTQLVQPKSLNDIFGQQHVLNKNSYLYSLLEEKTIPNIILWGPPGCGKTSLAHVISKICLKNCHRYEYTELHGSNYSLKELEHIFKKATEAQLKFHKQTVLFMDEIHRLTKGHRNLCLNYLRKNTIILIGATTDNPSFFLNNTFLNHCQVIVMQKLEICDLICIIKKALKVMNINILNDRNTINNYIKLKNDSTCIYDSAIEWLAKTSDGDARIALNNLELFLQHNNNENKIIKINDIKDQIKKAHLVYDRNGEEHHNIISAMHESIKGYSDNAALYWTTRMLMGGENPMFIARRLVRTSSEDTGNADTRALKLAVSTMHACQTLETSDSEIVLAQCVIYLARAPTYKKTITALKLVKDIISKAGENQPCVPIHLRHISPEILQDINAESGKKGTKQSFMPSGLENINFL